MRIDEFVGIPWRDLGRTRDGCDCWGLVLLVFRDLGIELPALHEAYSTAADHRQVAGLVDGVRGDWSPINAGSERPFDAILFTQGRIPSHVGIVVKPGKMLHLAERQSSLIETYRDGKWHHRIEGFYRHKALA